MFTIQIDWQSVTFGILKNFAFMLILIYFYSKLYLFTEKINKILNSIIIGVCFGFFAVVVIKYPIAIIEGIFFDSRLVIISLTGIFGSWISALIVVIISGSYRLFVGGIGAYTGTIMIILSGISGIIFGNIKLLHKKNKYIVLLLLGLIQVLICQSFIFLLPYDIAIRIFKTLFIPSLIYHPISIIILGAFLYHEKEYILIQQKIKESEIKFKSLFTLSPDPIFIIDKKTGKILDVNDNVLNVYKYTKDELLHMKDIDVSAEPDKNKTGTKKSTKYIPIQYHKKKSGEIFPVSITSSIIKLNNRNVIISTIQDLNILKKAEEELLREKIFTDKAINSQIDTFYIFDPETKKAIRWNKSFESISGYSFEEVASLKIPDSYYKKEELKKINNSIKKILDNTPVTIKLSLITKEKQEIPFEYQTSLLIDPLTKKKYIVSIGRDIKERLKTEKILQESEIKYKRLAEGVPGILYIFSLQKGGVYYSDNVEKILGYSKKYLYKHPFLWNQSIHLEDKAKVKSIISNFYKGENFEVEYRLMNKKGKWVWLFDRSIGRRVINDEIFIEGLAIDITEKKILEEEIRNMNKVLEDKIKKRTEDLEIANKELEAFSFSISHDLRAPLRAISGFSNLLLEEYKEKLDNQGKYFLNNIIKSSKNMSQLIEDLLEFSRISRKEIDRADINTEKLIQETYNELLQFEPKRKIELKLDNLFNIYGDESMIKQVFINLLSNALKYTRKKKKSRITINSREIKDKNMVEYYIEDNGIGFNMKYYDKLFNVFQRLHSSNEYEGTGVGLALVQRILKKHGGKVWADSKMNKGTTIYFWMPKK